MIECRIRSAPMARSLQNSRNCVDYFSIVPKLSAKRIAKFWAIADKCKQRHRRQKGDLCAACQRAWDREFNRAYSPSRSENR